MANKDFASVLQEEMFYGVKKREKLAYAFGAGCLVIACISVSAVALMLPLKQTEAFMAIVDKDTGIAQRVVSVEHAGVDQEDAIVQSLLYSYVVDRETFDEADNEQRILRAYSRSEGGAKQGLMDLWNESNPNYPPVVYGASSKVTVKVLSITKVSDTVAQVRFTKSLKAADNEREGKFSATITYQFEPTKESAIELVWNNPTGFMVTAYRVTPESQEAQ